MSEVRKYFKKLKIIAKRLVPPLIWHNGSNRYLDIDTDGDHFEGNFI